MTSALWAQPERELRTAIDHLMRAGNYSWEEKREIGLKSAGSPRPISVAAGETMIGGYTRARNGKVHFIMIDREVAFVLRDGWRHGDDLTVEDVAELHLPRAAAKSLKPVRPLPHVVLEMVFHAARDVRKESGVLVSSIEPTILEADTLDRYLRGGIPPTVPDTPTVLGLPLPKRIIPRGAASARAGQAVNFLVWQQAGIISRFSLEFVQPTRVLNGPNAGDQDKITSVYSFDLFDIGTTHADIPPEVQALYPNATSAR